MVQEFKTVSYDDLKISNYYVYFLKCNEFVKIGMTGNLLTRLQNFKTNNPLQMEIIGLFNGGRKEEAILHKKFEHLSLRNEWFLYNQEIAQYCSDFEAKSLDEIHKKLSPQCSIKLKYWRGRSGEI